MAASTPAQRREPQGRRVLEHVRTEFNTGKIVARGRARHFEVGGATYASFHPERRFFGYAWDALAAAALHHPAAARGGTGMDVLLVGLGGGTVLHALRLLLPRARLVAAEIDAALVGVCRRHFDLAGTGAEVVVGDGYAHMDGRPGGYDVVLDDAFLARGDAARVLVVDRSFLARMTRGLKPGGLLACNVFTDSANAGACAVARQAFRAAFPFSFELVPPRGENSIHCGTAAPRPLADVRAQQAQLPGSARGALERMRCLGSAAMRQAGVAS